MALAIIEYGNHDTQSARFSINLGSNKYWRYSIGDHETTGDNGLRVLRNTKYTSPTQGPLREQSFGRSHISVPVSLLDRENRYTSGG